MIKVEDFVYCEELGIYIYVWAIYPDGKIGTEYGFIYKKDDRYILLCR